MTKDKMPFLQQGGTENAGAEKAIDIAEWTELGHRLAIAGPEKYAEIVEALRKIVDAQETIAVFDWQLLFGARPTKRYQA